MFRSKAGNKHILLKNGFSIRVRLMVLSLIGLVHEVYEDFGQFDI